MFLLGKTQVLTVDHFAEAGAYLREGNGRETVLLPVRPRRCDHLRLRLEGEGELRLFSITRTLRKGSDLP